MPTYANRLMFLLNITTIISALVIAAGWVTGVAITPDALRSIAFLRDGKTAVLHWIGTIGALLIVIAMPRLRASFFGRIWRRRLPSSTYVLPAWLIRLALGMLIGQAVGAAFGEFLVDSRFLWLCSSSALLSAAFAVSARSRLSNPAGEFELPVFTWLRH